MCVPGPVSYSETFIADQISGLPSVIPVYGEFPYCTYSDQPLIPAFSRAVLRYGARLHPAVRRWGVRRAETDMAEFLRRRQAGMVLAQYATTAVSLLGVCRRAGVAVAAHFHGYDAYTRPVLSEYAEGYRRLFAEAAALICVSEAMRRQLLSLGAPEDKLSVNSCGVDLARFPPADASANAPVFVAAGRFVDKKAPLLTLLAFARVQRECPAARLVMVGAGPLREACVQMVKAMRLGEAVSLPGRMSPPQVAGQLSAGRAFVQHSLTAESGDSEGTPVAVLEAGACALPVVSTRHGGIPEAVIDGETGFLVEEGDVAAMAAAMLRLAQNPQLARDMGLRGRAHIERNYSLADRMAGLVRILEMAARR